MLKNHFDIKDLGEANFILSMKITKTCDEIFLDQSHYVEKILRKYNFHDHKSVGVLSRFTSKPSRDHWLAIKRVMRYLIGTKSYS